VIGLLLGGHPLHILSTNRAQTRDDLYDLLPAAASLFIADPTLLPQTLAGEQWI
jgi:hypothetical protein